MQPILNTVKFALQNWFILKIYFGAMCVHILYSWLKPGGVYKSCFILCPMVATFKASWFCCTARPALSQLQSLAIRREANFEMSLDGFWSFKIVKGSVVGGCLRGKEDGSSIGHFQNITPTIIILIIQRDQEWPQGKFCGNSKCYWKEWIFKRSATNQSSPELFPFVSSVAAAS